MLVQDWQERADGVSVEIGATGGLKAETKMLAGIGEVQAYCAPPIRSSDQMFSKQPEFHTKMYEDPVRSKETQQLAAQLCINREVCRLTSRTILIRAH